MHPNDYNCPFHGLFMNFSTPIIACCAYRCSYLRFSYHFRPRAESATFLLATLLVVQTESERYIAMLSSKIHLVISTERDTSPCYHLRFILWFIQRDTSCHRHAIIMICEVLRCLGTRQPARPTHTHTHTPSNAYALLCIGHNPHHSIIILWFYASQTKILEGRTNISEN